MVSGFTAVEHLGAHHDCRKFDSGKPGLDEWLRLYASQNERLHEARTYVTCPEDQHVVAGYYSLAVASIAREEAPKRIAKPLPRYPVPVMLLARLAVDRQWQRGYKLGRALLLDGMTRTLNVSAEAGLVALFVHALDDEAAGYYRRWGFEPSPFDALHLWLPMSAIAASVEAARE